MRQLQKPKGAFSCEVGLVLWLPEKFIMGKQKPGLDALVLDSTLWVSGSSHPW
jgi:hypothetical protein